MSGYADCAKSLWKYDQKDDPKITRVFPSSLGMSPLQEWVEKQYDSFWFCLRFVFVNFLRWVKDWYIVTWKMDSTRNCNPGVKFQLQIWKSWFHHMSTVFFTPIRAVEENVPPRIRPFKGMNKKYRVVSPFLPKIIGSKNWCFSAESRFLVGLGSSGRLVASISTRPVTCKSPWCRVMA